MLKNFIVIFICLFLILTCFYSGHLYSNDTLLKVQTAKNVLTKGTFALESDFNGWGSVGRNGAVYPNFSIGSILSFIPAVIICESFHNFKMLKKHDFLISSLVSLQNVIITSFSMSILFLILLSLNFSYKKSFIITSILLFSTEIFTYSSMGWNEPLALLFLLLGIFFLVANNQISESGRWLCFSIFSMIASLIRIELTLFILVFLLLSLNRNKINNQNVGLALLIFLISPIINMLYNYYRFEDFFNFGYSAKTISGEFKSQITLFRRINLFNFDKIKLLYLSFGRVHLFWAAPLFICVPFSLKKFKKLPAVLKNLFIASLFMVPFLGINSWAWANRYIYVLIPFLLIPLIQQTKGNFRKVIIFTSIFGIIVSFSGKIINYHVVLEEKVNKYGYNSVMVERSKKIIHAPVWTHLSNVFIFGKKTFTLFYESRDKNLEWKELRSSTYDIWPIGLIAVGVNPKFSFALWLLWSFLAFVYFKYVVIPFIAQRDIN